MPVRECFNLTGFFMLSLEQCKKYLKKEYTDEEVLALRDSLYQMANILIDNFHKEKENKKV